ncbi:sugar ABC transporter ATP-binding protein [uncultured Corynebacterium sp.]|uniref:ATP-binding cassette domain-containing protein n=1 Tax=uncultured Corynebacterium sp. TaxID=159447 RepID=UPI0025E09144|nr:sugar ABC transporter ATP-binding protein [uncultured Corynebacterium sp.]
MNANAQKVLDLLDVRKSFGANDVLRGVSFELRSGEVTALLGANGAGKSTLIKILAGLQPPTSGKILVAGSEKEFARPGDAKSAGIEIVHQRVDESIVNGLTVAENLCFEEIASGDLSATASKKVILSRARQIASSLELNWSDSFLSSSARNLSIADGQLLLLARALVHKPKILVLDEPTSTLSKTEVERLFEVVIDLKNKGVAILYVSHRMSEIRQLANNLIVLRDGKIVDKQEGTFDLGKAIDAMLGQEGAAEHHLNNPSRGNEVTVSLKRVRLFPNSSELNLELRSGEVTGIVGLIGAGKSELANQIYGLDAPISGSIELEGGDISALAPGESIRRGIYLVPEDRAAQAMLPDWSIAHTASLPFLSSVSSMGILSSKAERILAQKVIENLSIVCEDSEQNLDSLSGGNQQKVIVGRWLERGRT